IVSLSRQFLLPLDHILTISHSPCIITCNRRPAMASANCSVAASSLHLSCSTRQSALASLASPAPSAHPAALAVLSSLAASRRTASLPAPALAAPRQHRPSRARRAVRVMASQSEKRALISVSDKTGLDTLAKGLLDLGYARSMTTPPLGAARFRAFRERACEFAHIRLSLPRPSPHPLPFASPFVRSPSC
ncbi:unnamed protein product, partial [Closterium sp. NIES-53]